MLLLLLACAPVPVDPDAWPVVGCQSHHRPEWGQALVFGEEHRIEHDEIALAVQVLRPASQASDGCWPALVLVPPGFDEGLPEADSLDSQALAQSGVVVVTFDPRGRGQSQGEEQHGGPDQQDDLAAVLAWTASRPDVDPRRVHLRSRSLGIVLAGGALFRHPELAPASLMDIEGPARLPEELEYAPEQTRDTFYQISSGTEWWELRSPDRFLPSFRGHYRRVQALEDHALGGYLGHAQTLLNLAEVGMADEVDLNGFSEEVWTYDQVEQRALEGRVKHDDLRAMELLIELLRE
jgi:pimeloyl-ACP methyl ester carboxylesterase